ncbi:MAG: arginine--tRNA ligase [Spirochaetota bacterium]|nr:arginine--tRNA ligase [Spirochaetota bacterium]
MIIKDQIKEIVENSLEKAIKENKFAPLDFPEVKIEYPKEEKFGDYATALALESARILKKSPIEIGNTLKEYIEESDLIEKVDIAKPGFINIFLSTNILHQTLLFILEEEENYGRFTKNNPNKINIEFVSANPTGPLNIVSARAAALGDTLANLLEACGDIVDREYYINDHGNQVYLLGKSVLYRYWESLGKSVDFPEDGYHGDYISDIAEYLKKNYKDKIESFKDEDELIDFFAQKAVEYNIEGQKRDLERFNVKFDIWYSERSLHKEEHVPNALGKLESCGKIYIEDGKKTFKSTEYGDDKDRVVVRDDGRPTYLLADIAYHIDKIDRGYDLLIDIWGPDHHGYIARIIGAMKALGYEDHRLNILIAQQVNLIMKGEAVRMSKRLGKYSTMNELIDEIGTDVARYFFIMRSLESHLDFDLELAKRESSENPVFYLQYAHARICSIFREAEKRGINYNPSNSSIEFLNNPEAATLLKTILIFPEEVIDAANSLEPHRIANFLLKLARVFHKFYTEHRVISDNIDKTNTYLSICGCVRIVLKNGLGLLGVSAPERM